MMKSITEEYLGMSLSKHAEFRRAYKKKRGHPFNNSMGGRAA
jgi:hypothetical protein